jgi:hypothetical protein
MSFVDSKNLETAFFAVWTLVFAGFLIFWQVASPQTRRKAQPYAITFAGLVVLLFAWLQDGDRGLFFTLVPVAVIVGLNIIAVKTCRRCGAATRINIILPTVKSCAHCGHELGAARHKPASGERTRLIR